MMSMNIHPCQFYVCGTMLLDSHANTGRNRVKFVGLPIFYTLTFTHMILQSLYYRQTVVSKTRNSSINTVTEFDQEMNQEIRVCPITIPSWLSSHSRLNQLAQALHFNAPSYSALNGCVCMCVK